MNIEFKKILITGVILASFISCSKPADEGDASDAASSKGIGPISSVELAAVDNALAAKGETLFEEKCTACHHATDERMVGPGLHKVTERRAPEWIMNMIVNPTEMIQKDPIAKGLLQEYMTEMTNQNVNQDEARAILEYFRKNDA